MNFFLETLRFIGLLVYFTLEAFVLLFIPARKKNVTGEIVLITGAGSGVGRLLALKFGQLGATLVLWDINVEGNKETARLARENGVRVHVYTCDCSKRQEVYQVADQVKREVGDVSILINNAGIVTGKTFLDCPDSLIEKSMEVNAMAHFWTLKAFLPAMVAANHGHLVTIASSAGLFGVNKMADYCASKFAAVGFCEAIRMELLALGKTGVKTTTVCPFFMSTGMFEGCQTKRPRLLPILKPEYVADKIVSGILRNQAIIFLPRSMYFFVTFKYVISENVASTLVDYFGNHSFMDKFQGRAKKD
ncbi:epidermal retinol dehydrogenase 2-like isoform X2 [Tiliqua scincoides]